MNKMVFKQLLASWRSGIWIVLELVVLFVLLYSVLGLPLSKIYKDIAYERGYLQREDVIVVPAQLAGADELASYPGVKECESVQKGMFPTGKWYNGASVGKDSSSMVHCYILWRPETKAMSDMIGYEYVYPEGGPDWNDYGDNSMVISSDIAEHFFGSPQAAVGGMLHVGGDYNMPFEIVAVIKPLKFNLWGVPSSTLLLPYFAVDDVVEDPQCHFLSLHDGVDPEEFVTELNRDLKCKAEIYAHVLEEAEDSGYDESLVVMAISLFVVFNMLLCTLSFFYLRLKIRRDEVGVRLACGASHLSIMKLFIYEGLVLAVVASLIGMAVTVNMITHIGQFVHLTTPRTAGYVPVFNTPVTWYLVVSFADMLILAVISVMSSAFASSALMKMSVSSAFREE